MAKYAQDLGKNEDYGLWVFYDTGCNDTFKASLAEPLLELQRTYPNLNLFFYNWKPIEQLLPNAVYLKSMPSPNWWFHDASLMLWAGHCGLLGPTPFSVNGYAERNSRNNEN